MIESAHWIIALVVAVLIGVGGTLYFRLVRHARATKPPPAWPRWPRCRWRDFIHLVLDALARRGYTRVFNRETPSGDDDYTLERDGKHWLLSCKHGSAFVLGSAARRRTRQQHPPRQRRRRHPGHARAASPTRPSRSPRRSASNCSTARPCGRNCANCSIPQQRAEILAGAGAQGARNARCCHGCWRVVAGVAIPVPARPSAPMPSASSMPPPTRRAARPSAQRTRGRRDRRRPDRRAGARRCRRTRTAAQRRRRRGLDAADGRPRGVVDAVDAAGLPARRQQATPIPQICPLAGALRRPRPLAHPAQPPPGSNLPTRFRQCRSY